MDFTFGIITDGTSPYIGNLINSIRKQTWHPEDRYEIVVIGGNPIPNTVHILFDDTIRHRWITKKKNMITNIARYENIVYTHDYLELEQGWLDGWRDVNYKVGTNILLNPDFTRATDWTLKPCWADATVNTLFHANHLPITADHNLLPYDIEVSKFQYMPGNYWVAKKSVMEEFPLNDNLLHSQLEDVEWSNRVSQKYTFTMNTYAKVIYQKDKPRARMIPKEVEEFFRNFYV